MVFEISNEDAEKVKELLAKNDIEYTHSDTHYVALLKEEITFQIQNNHDHLIVSDGIIENMANDLLDYDRILDVEFITEIVDEMVGKLE